jgi:hypothetical protein
MFNFLTRLLTVARLVLDALIPMADPLRALVALNLKDFLTSLGLVQVVGVLTMRPLRMPAVHL